jgi:transcription-repair coupling factor (superfamily II helicase)
MQMKQKQTRSGMRLLLKIDHVKSIDKAFEQLNSVMPLQEVVSTTT